MGMLLMTQDGAPLIREHMSLSVTKSTHTGSNIRDGIVNDVDNNDGNETTSNNELTRFPVLEIINVNADNQKPIPRMSPPPKKKWMRHYLLMEEEPLESNRANGNHSIGLRGSPVIANARGTLTNPNSTTASAHVTSQHHHIHHYQPQSVHQHHNNHNSSTHNHYVENYNSNHTPTGSSGGGSLVVDVETTHDNKKHRNGPCVIRSGTREVHNKLEKNRRAHLKECFELLKKQLPAQDEKKSSNLSILHAAIRHIQALRRKERDYEHEMEKLAREKIASQQRVAVLKRELSATWDHIDFSTLLQEQTPPDPLAIKNVSESMDVDLTGLARSGPRYSSTSSLSSAATANSPQNFQSTNTTSSIQSQVATAAVVCQTQGLNLAQSSRESPPASSSPGASTPSIPTPAQEKVTTSPAVVQQSHQLHLPISAQMLNTSQGLATIVPTLQHLGTGLRVIPGDTRQLLVTHTTGNAESRPLTLAVQNSNDQSRPLIAVQSSTGSEPRPVALVVHSSAANDNRVTFVHSSNLSNQERPLALAVQSSSNDRPITFVHSGNEGRPLVLATHPPPLNVTTAQTRIRSGDSHTTHKMVGGVALVSGNGSELTRLPGGAELNILPANGVFRSVKAQPIAVQGGLTLSHAGVSLQTSTGKVNSTVMQNTPSTESITHIVGQHTPLSGLTPIVTPMTVVSQGNQVTAHILAPSNLAGKMITTPILKPVGQVPLVNAQYLNTTTLVKPVVVVSSPSNTTTASTVTSSSQPSVTSNSSV